MSGLSKQVPLWGFILSVLIAFGGAATVWGQSKQELTALRAEVQEAKARFTDVSKELNEIRKSVDWIEGYLRGKQESK